MTAAPTQQFSTARWRLRIDGYPARREETHRRGRCRGIGLGTYVESQSGSPEEEAVVRVLPQGAIEVEIGTLSSGQGHETSYAQLLGEWLGVESERIRLVTGDSDRTKFGAGSHSGRSIRLASISMHAAAHFSNEGCKSLRICWRRRPTISALQTAGSRSRAPIEQWICSRSPRQRRAMPGSRKHCAVR